VRKQNESLSAISDDEAIQVASRASRQDISFVLSGLSSKFKLRSLTPEPEPTDTL
jgi:hypothetical protein